MGPKIICRHDIALSGIYYITDLPSPAYTCKSTSALRTPVLYEPSAHGSSCHFISSVYCDCTDGVCSGTRRTIWLLSLKGDVDYYLRSASYT